MVWQGEAVPVPPILLEVIALGPDDALAAESGGADRLELVADMSADGLTPSVRTFTAVRTAVDIPVRVMLRANSGFAAGSPKEVDELAADAAELRSQGADEFVLGFLDPAAGPDLDALRTVVDALDGCPWTFHRAIDRAADRDALRRRVSDAALPGLDAYLTAGSPSGVPEGLAVLAAEAARTAAGEPGYEPRVLVGGGLSAGHVAGLRAAGLDAFHVGGAVRPDGWSGAVDAGAVAEWRGLVDG